MQLYTMEKKTSIMWNSNEEGRELLKHEFHINISGLANGEPWFRSSSNWGRVTPTYPITVCHLCVRPHMYLYICTIYCRLMRKHCARFSLAGTYNINWWIKFIFLRFYFQFYNHRHNPIEFMILQNKINK